MCIYMHNRKDELNMFYANRTCLRLTRVFIAISDAMLKIIWCWAMTSLVSGGDIPEEGIPSSLNWGQCFCFDGTMRVGWRVFLHFSISASVFCRNRCVFYKPVTRRLLEQHLAVMTVDYLLLFIYFPNLTAVLSACFRWQPGSSLNFWIRPSQQAWQSDQSPYVCRLVCVDYQDSDRDTP